MEVSLPEFWFTLVEMLETIRVDWILNYLGFYCRDKEDTEENQQYTNISVVLVKVTLQNQIFHNSQTIMV